MAAAPGAQFGRDQPFSFRREGARTALPDGAGAGRHGGRVGEAAGARVQRGAVLVAVRADTARRALPLRPVEDAEEAGLADAGREVGRRLAVRVLARRARAGAVGVADGVARAADAVRGGPVQREVARRAGLARVARRPDEAREALARVDGRRALCPGVRVGRARNTGVQRPRRVVAVEAPLALLARSVEGARAGDGALSIQGPEVAGPAPRRGTEAEGTSARQTGPRAAFLFAHEAERSFLKGRRRTRRRTASSTPRWSSLDTKCTPPRRSRARPSSPGCTGCTSRWPRGPWSTSRPGRWSTSSGWPSSSRRCRCTT